MQYEDGYYYLTAWTSKYSYVEQFRSHRFTSKSFINRCREGGRASYTSQLTDPSLWYIGYARLGAEHRQDSVYKQLKNLTTYQNYMNRVMAFYTYSHYTEEVALLLGPIVHLFSQYYPGCSTFGQDSTLVLIILQRMPQRHDGHARCSAGAGDTQEKNAPQI